MLIAVIVLGVFSARDIATLGVALLIVAMSRLQGGAMAALLVAGTSCLTWLDTGTDIHRLLAWSLFMLVLLLFLSRRLVDMGEPGALRARVVISTIPHLPLLWGVSNSAVLTAGLLGFCPKGQALRWSIILCLTAYVLYRQSSDHELRRPLPWMPLLSGYALVTLLSLGFVEIALRLSHPKPEPSVQYEPHPSRGVAYRPNTTLQLSVAAEKGLRKEYELHISSQGIRDREYPPKAPGEFRVLMLGDSYVTGLGVQENDMPSRLLERSFAERCPGASITVINAGIAGYGPWQEHLLLLEKCAALQPDFVVHEIYITNDIHDEMRRTDEVLQAYSMEQLRFWFTRRYAEYWSVILDSSLLSNPISIANSRTLQARAIQS